MQLLSCHGISAGLFSLGHRFVAFHLSHYLLRYQHNPKNVEDWGLRLSFPFPSPPRILITLSFEIADAPRARLFADTLHNSFFAHGWG